MPATGVRVISQCLVIAGVNGSHTGDLHSSQRARANNNPHTRLIDNRINVIVMFGHSAPCAYMYETAIEIEFYIRRYPLPVIRLPI